MFCYDDKVVVVAWGMVPDTNQHKVIGAIIKDLQFEERFKVRFDVGNNGKLPLKIDSVLSRSRGVTLGSIDIPSVIANEGWRFLGWEPQPIGHKVVQNVTFIAKYEKEPEKICNDVKDELIRAFFVAENGGRIDGCSYCELPKGTSIPKDGIPSVIPNEGYTFAGWDKPIDEPISEDTEFRACFKKTSFTYCFLPGAHGSIDGIDKYVVSSGEIMPSNEVPHVLPQKGFKFVGWDKSIDAPAVEDCTFTALYDEETVPWYVRLKNWFSSFWSRLKAKGCLKKLLWLLLLLLLLLILGSLLRTCARRGGGGIFGGGENSDVGDPSTDVAPIERIEHEDGSITDNNGVAHDIIGDDGRLPDDISDHSVVAPITDETGKVPPVISHPGAPDIIANRLNIYFEDEDVDLNQFAIDFKTVYPSSDYKIIGADDNVKAVQIQIPEEQRDNVRETINSRMPGYKFFVVDESIFTLVGRISESKENTGWHLAAINLKSGWSITKGKEDVIVAVVDDGIDATHDMLKGRICYPYNVFTQNNRLSVGEGHGTHVAALAVGSDAFFSKGASGVAPYCKLMPIQVFDNEMCTFSSVTSGIMYAIHHGADVINVSIGPKFNGLNILPPHDQMLISETQFKNEEKVFNKIFDIAQKKNVIIVFAAGNDDILARIAPENRTNKTINVSAISPSLQVTEFSNYGIGTNISAPGEAIYSAYPVNDFASFDGTSMAAPIVSGTVALLKSIDKSLNVTQVISILQQSGKSVTGNVPPMVQVDLALQLAKTGNFDMPSDQGTPIDNEEPEIGTERPGNSTSPDSGNNSRISNETPDSQTDYDAIRRMIEEYKRKIAELEKLLPENQ
jgi:subtilisin family serine protease